MCTCTSSSSSDTTYSKAYGRDAIKPSTPNENVNVADTPSITPTTSSKVSENMPPNNPRSGAGEKSINIEDTYDSTKSSTTEDSAFKSYERPTPQPESNSNNLSSSAAAKSGDITPTPSNVPESNSNNLLPGPRTDGLDLEESVTANSKEITESVGDATPTLSSAGADDLIGLGGGQVGGNGQDAFPDISKLGRASAEFSPTPSGNSGGGGGSGDQVEDAHLEYSEAATDDSVVSLSGHEPIGPPAPVAVNNANPVVELPPITPPPAQQQVGGGQVEQGPESSVVEDDIGAVVAKDEAAVEAAAETVEVSVNTITGSSTTTKFALVD